MCCPWRTLWAGIGCRCGDINAAGPLSYEIASSVGSGVTSLGGWSKW